MDTYMPNMEEMERIQKSYENKDYEVNDQVLRNIIQDMQKRTNELWSGYSPTFEEEKKMSENNELKPWQERIMQHDEKIGLLNNLLTKIFDLREKGLPIATIAKEVNLPEATVRHYIYKDVLSSTYGTKQNDPVNHPSHYTDGKIEVIDFIEDKKLGFHLGNAVKYISRAGKKDPSKKVEDLKKAKWYLDRYIDMLTRTDPITYKDCIPPQFGGDTDGDNLTMPIPKTVLGDEHAINLCHLDKCAQASSKPEDYKGVTAKC